MLVYQLMSAQHGLANLRGHRLKVSFIDDLNDPFELIGASLKNPKHRRALRHWRDHMGTISRLLCVSRTWDNPVLWSHYADKHKGLCLGFEVPNANLLPVSYEAARLELDLENEIEKSGTVGTDISRRLLTTKFADWQYENEVRMFVKPAETQKIGDLEFYPFGNDLILRKIIFGARCEITKHEIQSIEPYRSHRMDLIKTRLAFQTFRIIQTPPKTRRK